MAQFFYVFQLKAERFFFILYSLFPFNFNFNFNYNMAMFQARDISLQLPDGRWLFQDISFDLEEGNTLVMRGPSGVG